MTEERSTDLAKERVERNEHYAHGFKDGVQAAAAMDKIAVNVARVLDEWFSTELTTVLQKAIGEALSYWRVEGALNRAFVDKLNEYTIELKLRAVADD